MSNIVTFLPEYIMYVCRFTFGNVFYIHSNLIGPEILAEHCEWFMVVRVNAVDSHLLILWQCSRLDYLFRWNINNPMSWCTMSIR